MNKIKSNIPILKKFSLFLIITVLNIYNFSFSQSIINNNSSHHDRATVKDTFPPYILPFIQEGDGTVKSTVIDMPEDENIRTNMGGIYPGSPINYELKYDTIVPGVTHSVNFEFNVRDKFSDAAVDVDFKDFIGNTTSLSIRYKAPKFKLTPGNQNLLDVVTSQTIKTEFIIINESYSNKFLLTKLKLKYEDQGFKINFKNEPGYLSALPKIFKPRDSLLIEIEFNATKIGNFIDSIGFGNDYIFKYAAQVSANVLSPQIIADDYDFFDVTIGDTVVKSLYVKNNSDKVDLILTGYTAVKKPFRTDLPQITPEMPYILKPGFRLNFNVYFTPDTIKEFKDSIVFQSNSVGPDNISYLNGRGVKPGLIATSYDWGRRRIDRPDRPELTPVSPYTNFERAVWLENTTTDTIELYNIEIIDVSKAYAFEYTKDQVPKFLAPRKPVFIEIGFHPIEVGYHEAIFIYHTSIGSESRSVFKGIGIAPKITTNDVDFDTTLVNALFSPITRKVKFKNQLWEYQDIMEIKNLQFLPDSNSITWAISNPSATWGTEGFKIIFINKDTIPTILNPGDSLMLEVIFVAQKEGQAIAGIRSFSDALKDTTAILNGYGIFYGLKPNWQSSEACVGDIDTISCFLKHYGFQDIFVDSLVFYGDTSSFKLLNPNLATGFNIKTGQTYEFNILFEPRDTGIRHLDIYAYYNAISKNEFAILKLSAQAYHAERTYRTFIMNPDTVIDLGEKIELNTMLEFGDDISRFNTNHLAIKVNFNPNFLKILPENIKRGDLLKGKFFQPQNIKINNDIGEIYFELKAIGDLSLTGDGQLFTLNFDTKLPVKRDTIYKSDFIIDIASINNSCVDFINDNIPEITLNDSISPYIKWVDFRPQTNAILDIYPNPADQNGTYVNFQVTEQDFYTLDIYNTLSNHITNIYNGQLVPGEYKAYIPTYNFPSGIYFITLKSKDFLKSRQFIYTH